MGRDDHPVGHRASTESDTINFWIVGFLCVIFLKGVISSSLLAYREEDIYGEKIVSQQLISLGSRGEFSNGEG